MAWYNIDYACGCSGREQIYGTNRNGERDRKQAWLGTRDCKDSEYRKCTIAEYKQYTAERAARIEWHNKYAAELKAAGEI